MIDNNKTLTPARRPAALDLSIICLAGFILSLVINYPGFMSYHSVQQLLEARAGAYSDMHPPFMAFLWHFTDRIVPGPFGMLVVETALIWCGTYLISLFWFSDAHPILRLAPCLLVFYPPIFGISGVIWSDIIHVGVPHAGDWHGRSHKTRLGGDRISVHRKICAWLDVFIRGHSVSP